MLSLAERIDIELARALYSIYANTDIAARFVIEELHQQAQGAIA